MVSPRQFALGAVEKFELGDSHVSLTKDCGAYHIRGLIGRNPTRHYVESARTLEEARKKFMAAKRLIKLAERACHS